MSGTTTPSRWPLVALTVVVILADAGFVIIGLIVLQGIRSEHLTSGESAFLLLLAASAALGAITLLLAAAGLIRGARGHLLARSAAVLCVVRTAGLISAVLVIALRGGVAVTSVPLTAFLLLLALMDLAGAVAVTRTALRLTRQSPSPATRTPH